MISGNLILMLFLIKMFIVTLNLPNDIALEVEIRHDCKTSSFFKSFALCDETSDVLLSGPPENFGALFTAELEERYGNNVQVLAQIVQSCDFLGMSDENLRVALYRLIKVLPRYTGDRIELTYRSLPNKILDWYDVDTLLLFGEKTTLVGPIKLGRKENPFLGNKLLLQLSAHFDIVELDAGDNPYLYNIAPFAKTLRKLDASGEDCGIRDSDLLEAHWIEELNVRNNRKVTTVEPFAPALRVLDASGDCGFPGNITDAGLASARWIEELNVSSNPRITTIAPFAATLKKLTAQTSYSGLCDAALASAHRIEELDVSANANITTVAPFARSLRKLVARLTSGIRDAGLIEARWIEELDATWNCNITTVSPFGNTLRILNAGWSCGIDDLGLRDARRIEELGALNNPRITNETYSLVTYRSQRNIPAAATVKQ